MDITSVSAALASIKTASDIAKLIKDSGVSLEKAETKLKLADLIGNLADARILIADIKEVLSNKEGEIRRLQDALEVRGNLTWEPPYYWKKSPDGKDGPFCQHCYDAEGKLLRLHGYDNGYWDCKACKNGFQDKGFNDSPFVSIAAKRDPFADF